MSTAEVMGDAQARRQLRDKFAAFNCRVHQPDDPPLFSRHPLPGMQSHHWKWQELQPLLESLGQEIDLGDKGPRRTLRLASPGLAQGTTPTFWASIQVILPGEVASAHRHTANAFRFVMSGSGATTTVDGQCYRMNEGDLVLTPSWAWHDHEYAGDEPMIWLDVLDISLMHSLQATFFEGYPELKQPVAPVPDLSDRRFGSGLMRPPQSSDAPASGVNPVLVYSRDMAQAALAKAEGASHDPLDDVVLEYQNPQDGSSAMPTMGMELQMLRPAGRTRARRTTGSRLFYVIRGGGTSNVGNHQFDWEAGDFFTVAPWHWFEHVNRSSSEDALLFQVNDLPVIRKVGFYREEKRA